MAKHQSISQDLGLFAGLHVLDDYILEEQIGEGGMGVVWRAQNKNLDRHEAIKFIRKRTPEFWRKRFAQEARTAARFTHPNVITIYNAKTWGVDEHGREMLAIFMELMSGTSLDRAFPTDLLSALDIFLQVVQGLIVIHDKGIVHRDLKPHNIFVEEQLGPTGQIRQLAKIGDFGIAQLPDAPFGVETTAGTVFGTMLYASPEQIRDTSSTDVRSDLYSLGLIFWQVLGQTLTLPQAYYQALDNDELIAAKQRLPEPPSFTNPDWNIPPQLDDLVLKLLQPDPAQRFQTVREVYQALISIQTTLVQLPVRLPTTVPRSEGEQLSFDDIGKPSRTDAPTILSVTDVMRSRSVDAVRQLFAKLGYPISTDPLLIDQSWYTQSYKAIEQAFWITNYNLGGDAFGVILLELNDSSATVLQSIGRDLLRRGGNWLFVAAKTAQNTVGELIYEQLLFIAPQRGAAPDCPRLLRLAVDIDRPTRHTLDVMRDMALPHPLPSPSAIYAKVLDAFNVEVTTKRFYSQYARLFRELVTAVRKDNVMIAEFSDIHEVEGFVQRLLSRLMFLYFLQKKGWLAGDQAFLTSQFGIVSGQLDNYYRDFLVPLFFKALALPENERNTDPDKGPVWSQIDVPFLNGGLFEVGVGQDYELDWRSTNALGVQLDNRYFTPDSSGAFDIGGGESGGILAFFNRYEFTVEEDTPEDIAVSLDPEMLGKVFEELITERHETGSYYTPRPVVTFMCREALKGLL
ncbi:MAG: serine/threonine-protein kinase [Roseiflexaceae bacterium]|nr:serine/threonine-protein kinase [Roseiflexaceae bacterium]